MSKELKITDEQKAKLKEVAEKARTEMEEKTKKLREEFENEILSVLTDEQRKQYKEMVGEAIRSGSCGKCSKVAEVVKAAVKVDVADTVETRAIF